MSLSLHIFNLIFICVDFISSLTGKLMKLKDLVVEAKDKDIKVVAAVVKRMLEKNMFLFGSVEMIEGSVAETLNQLTELQNARVQVAYEKYVAYVLISIDISFVCENGSFQMVLRHLLFYFHYQVIQ